MPRPTTTAKVLIVGATNLALVAALLAVPSVLGSESSSILNLSVMLVSSQAGQSTAVQVNVRFTIVAVRLVASAVVLALLAAIVAEAVDNEAILAFVFAACGVMFGLSMGAAAAEALQQGGALSYQVFIFRRTAIWLLAVTLCSVQLETGPVVGTVAAWLLLAVSLCWPYFRRRGEGRTGERGSWRTAMGGSAAAVVYRNDVNVVRATALAAGMFERWHLYLVLYAVAQSAVGFGVVNVLYARRMAYGALLDRRLLRRIVLLLCPFWLLPAIVVLVPVAIPFAVVGLLLALAGVATALQAAAAHLVAAHNFVYLAGVASFATLACIAFWTTEPDIALAGQLVVLGILVAAKLFMGSEVHTLKEHKRDAGHVPKGAAV